MILQQLYFALPGQVPINDDLSQTLNREVRKGCQWLEMSLLSVGAQASPWGEALLDLRKRVR